MRFDLAEKGRFNVPQARVVETLGNPDDQRQISLIAIHAHGIPDDFPRKRHRRERGAEPPTLAGRDDLRDVPLVTIDPADARDHDDAVYAEPDTDAGNPGGWIVWVAIADVAAYVRPGSELDREARRAATASTSPTGSSRCCPSASPTACAPCARARTAPAWPCGWCSARTAASAATRSCAA